METITLLIISGLVGFSCLLWGDFLLYKRYKQSKEKLIDQLNNAEKDIQNDIQNIDKTELSRTKAGKDLLKLLNQTSSITVRESKPKIDLQWTRAPNLSNSMAYLALIIGIIGTIAASVIGVIGNHNLEALRQEVALTQISLVAISTQVEATHQSSIAVNSPIYTNRYAKISDEVDEVNLRYSPGYLNKNDNTDIIAKIPKGAVIEIVDGWVGKDGLTWWKVSWNGHEGWIADHTSDGSTVIISN